MRIVTKTFLAILVGAMFAAGRSATAEPTNGLLCEWREDDIFQDDYAHSSICTSEPPQGGNDWVVISYGHWTNSHSVWVYTTILNEPGDSHTPVEP